jgi:hypothetical protein
MNGTIINNADGALRGRPGTGAGKVKPPQPSTEREVIQ